MKDLYYVLMKNNLGNASTCRKLIKQGKITVNGEVIKDHKYPVKFSITYTYHICNNKLVIINESFFIK